MSKKLAILVMTICYALPNYITASDKKDRTTTTTTSHDKKGIFSSVQEINLITNPSFENRTSSWILGKHNGATGLFTIDTVEALCGKQSAVVFTENQGKDHHDVQLFTFLELSRHTQYAIFFKAKVSKTCLITISIRNGVETFFEEELLLQPGITSYGPFNFKSEVDDPFAFFTFNLGRIHNEIHFDDVTIQADYTEKKFNQILANSGINIHQYNGSKELYISLPTSSSDDFPAIFVNENGQTVSTAKIRKGEQEVHFTLDPEFREGRYVLKIFTPSGMLAYNFNIEE